MFRYVQLTSDFGVYRQEHPGAQDLDCFIGLLSERVSSHAQYVLQQARKRTERYETLLERVFKAMRKRSKKNLTDWPSLEATFLKVIIDFERASNASDKTWTFANEGIQQVTDDFFLFSEYLSSAHNEHIKRICSSWAPICLSAEESERIQSLATDAERSEEQVRVLQPRLQPAWFFLIALCQVLHGGENPLSGVDAYWLGLIDEVIGTNEVLPSLRLIAERTPPAAQGDLFAASTGEAADGSPATAQPTAV